MLKVRRQLTNKTVCHIKKEIWIVFCDRVVSLGEALQGFTKCDRRIGLNCPLHTNCVFDIFCCCIWYTTFDVNHCFCLYATVRRLSLSLSYFCVILSLSSSNVPGSNVGHFRTCLLNACSHPCNLFEIIGKICSLNA